MSFDRNEWKPTRKQELFLALPWTIKEAFFGGGMGGGKSDILLVYPLVHKLHMNPRFKQVFMRRKHTDLKKEIVPRSRELYLKFGATFNATDMVWTFPRLDQFGSGARNNGALIFLGHCEHEKDVHNYDSMEINLFTPDELQSFTEYIYLYIGFKRVRTSDPALPAIIRAGGMPGDIGHTFVKKRYIDPAPAGEKVIIGKGNVKRFYVHSTLLDNPHIDPTYRSGFEQLPEHEKKAALGDWNAFQGQVFDEFRDKPYPDEPLNALHTIEPFEIPSWWPRFVVGDWGYAAMTYVGFYAVSPQKRLYLYRELYWLKTKIEEWAPIIKDFCDKEEPKIVKFCKSAGQDRGQEHTIQEQISSAIGRGVELSNNSPGSRVAGKMMVHEYLRWKEKKIIPKDEILIYDEELAMRLYRIYGEEKYSEYLKLFEPPVPETNIPKLQIFRCDSENHEGHPDCCPVMIDAIKACVYDKTHIEDVAEFPGDDPYDDLRYACDTADNYFRDAQLEFEKVQKQAELVELLKREGDWTAFYRNMRTNESLTRIRAVSRYRH